MACRTREAARLDHGATVVAPPLAPIHPLSELRFVTMWLFIVACYISGPVGACFLLLSAYSRSHLRLVFSAAAMGVALTLVPLRGRWEAFLRLIGRLFNPPGRPIGEYFGFEVVTEGKLLPGRRYLMANFPHGVFNVAAGYHGWHLITKQGLKPSAAGASVLFKLPILRQLMTWGGAVPATRSEVNRMLRRPYPNVSLITPGGIAEIFLGNGGESEEIIMLKERKGFVKLALANGTDLVPVYYLGNSQLFTRLDGGGHDGWAQRLSRRLRVSLVIFCGRWGLPVPYRTRLVALQGEPIAHPTGEPIASPTQEQIDDYHAQYMSALRSLYERNRHRVSGWEKRELKML